LVDGYLKARESHFKILVIQFIQMVGFKVIVTAGLLIIGGLLVLNQEMNIGQFVAAEIIILLVIASVEKLILGLESFYDVLTSLEKMGQVVDKRLESQDGIEVDQSESLKIELDKVTYEVPNRGVPILNNISMTINPSSRILVKGPSGSGKSTLLRMISGIIEPTKGRIFVNDESIQNIHLNNYRSCLGLSLAEETPFEGSIRENLTLKNNNITEQEINEAIAIVGLRDYLKETEKGLDTIIYPEGKQMSFTVAKKLILARAILKKPKVLVLEEPLEHFEATEAKGIIKALTAPENPWALIVASFNKDWTGECTEVITLNNGEII
jgi:ABC-type bacteriocin/lantibiotic exporter with double-glycine peptidase domain